MALINRFAIRNAIRLAIRSGIPNFSRARVAAHRMLQVVSQHRGVSLLALLTLLVAGAIAPLVGQQKAEQGKRGERAAERDSATLIRKRADWFFKQRAFPLGFIPSGARIKAIHQMEQMRRTQGTLMDRFAAHERITPPSFGAIPALSMTNWTPIGPQPTSEPEPLFFGNTSGRVNAIAVDPCDTSGNTVYIAGAQGGVWKTTNANSTSGSGPTWTPLTDSQPSLAGGSLAVDPVIADCTGGHTGKIYFGTGEENFSSDSFYGAGVLVSTDGSGSSSSWKQDVSFMPSTTPQSVNFGGPFIGSLAVDPATSGSTQVLLAGIQGVSAVAHSGVYLSADAGNSWTKVLPASSSTFDFGTGVGFDPGDSTGRSAYAVLGFPGGDTNNGLYRSTDGGNTWSRVMTLDNAVTSAGLSTANYSRITLALAAGSPPSTGNTTIVVAIADASTGASNLLGTFISTNGGTTFSQLTAGNSNAFCNQQCFYDISVGIDPLNPNAIFLGGGPNAGGPTSPFAGLSSVIFSSNGGTTFADVSLDNTSQLVVHVDNHAFAFAHPTSGPNIGQSIVYVGDDGGVWSSSNVESVPGSQSWANLNNDLNLTQFYPGNSIHPSNPQIGFAGAQDNGTQRFDPTFNGSNPQNWENVESCGDGGWTAIDPTTPSTVFAACEDLGFVGQNPVINKNQVDGLPGTPTLSSFAPNWISIDSGAIDADNANFVPPLVLDPLTPSNLYFGTCRVWQSMTGGISWVDISGALDGSALAGQPCPGPSSTFAGSLVITTMAVAPTDSNTVYVGAETPQPSGGIISSLFATPTAGMGAGATFTEFDKSGTTPNDRVVTQIAVSPASARVSYVTYSGFSSCGSANGCDGLGHIFKIDCTAACAYTDISGNLPDVPVNDIVIDPNDNTNNTIYIATDVGVLGTTNGGTNWLPLAGSLPHVECTSLKLNNTARVLRVGTHGRGSWDLQLAGLAASALTGMSPTSATAGGGSFALTLNGQGFPGSPTVNFGSTTATVNTASATQIKATVPSGAISGSGVAAVTVTGAAGSLNFSIEGPAPILGPPLISPTSVSSTASPVTITVTGSNFTASTGLVWTPNSGSQAFNSSFVPQNAGSLSGTTSFTVTVPATLLASTLSRMVPTSPSRRPGPGPNYWFLVALFAAVAGMLLFTFVSRRRRLILGTTLTTVVVLLSIAGCGGNNNGPPPPPGSVIVAIDAYTPGPGGGLSASTQTQSFTVQ
ncbi:MAG TPA: IPT/TIG domain-containing protein [Candidatus Acidoferrales bacterium]|nr:IPT/TIG domain-containing protein [Candidatus Acidoferrales bacterium]